MLVAYDGSDESKGTLSCAVDLAALHGRELLFVSVSEGLARQAEVSISEVDDMFRFAQGRPRFELPQNAARGFGRTTDGTGTGSATRARGSVTVAQ
jgi:nucleotide-binding universal stress UspA family protein